MTLLYLYPGADSSPGEGTGSPLVDAAQHLAFSNRHDALVAQNYRVVGISSQAVQAQRAAVSAYELKQLLLSDPELHLASELGLPTFEHRGRRWYHRLTLVVTAGTIAQVFFPITTGGVSTAEAFRWLRRARLWSPCG